MTYHTFTSLHLSLSLVDRWGTKDDRATTVLHSSLFSAFRRASPNFKLILSIPLRCLPISFSVCLSFSLLVQCPVGSSLQVLLILFCAHTISVCVTGQKREYPLDCGKHLYRRPEVNGQNTTLTGLMARRSGLDCRATFTLASIRPFPFAVCTPTVPAEKTRGRQSLLNRCVYAPY